MRYIRTYEELDLSKLNPLRFLRGDNSKSVERLIKDLNLELIGTKETKFKDKDYQNYTLKIPSSGSIMISQKKLNLEVYATLRIDKENNFRINTYVKFRENIIESLGLRLDRRLLRIRPISFTLPEQSPFFINSLDRKESLIKVNTKKIQNGFDNLKTSLEEVVNNTQNLLNLVSTEIETINAYSKDDLARKRLQKEEEQKRLEILKKKEEEQSKMLKRRLEYYKDLYEDVTDYFLELLDLCDKEKSNSSFTDLNISLRFVFNSKVSNGPFLLFDDKSDQVMRSLIQARKRIINKYTDLKISVALSDGLLSIIITNDKINGDRNVTINR